MLLIQSERCESESAVLFVTLLVQNLEGSQFITTHHTHVIVHTLDGVDLCVGNASTHTAASWR